MSSTTTSRPFRGCTARCAAARASTVPSALLRDREGLAPALTTKSGFMLGLGERRAEVRDLLERLREARVDIVTIGQYLRPSRENLPVVEYVRPEVFERLPRGRARRWDSGTSSRGPSSGPRIARRKRSRRRRRAETTGRRRPAHGAKRGRRADAPAAGALSGLLFALAFPPFGGPSVLPLALVPWLARARAREEPHGAGAPLRRASSAWSTGACRSAGSSTSSRSTEARAGVMGVVCLADPAPHPRRVAGPRGVGHGRAGRRRVSAARLAVFPAPLGRPEHARSFVYKGFPWNLTGHALFRQPLWLQSASLWGVYGLVEPSRPSAGSPRPGDRDSPACARAALAALLVAALGLFGALRLSRPAGGRRAGESSPSRSCSRT